MTTGVVLARTGSTYRVHTDTGEVTAVLRGKLKHRDDDRVVAGDVVDLELQSDGHATISGVRRDLQHALRREGYNLRVYVPFGDQWYPYLMRRLAERPANIAFLLGNILKESVRLS